MIGSRLQAIVEAVGVKETAHDIASLGPASEKASGSLNRATKEVHELDSAMGKLPGQIKGVVSGLGAFGLAANGIQQITGMAKGLGNALGVGLNIEMENVTAQLKAFTGSGDVAAQVLARIRKEADQTPFSFQAMAQATTALLPAAKQAGVGLMDLIKQAEILAALNPAEGLAGAAFSLREAMSGDWTSIVERFNLPRSAINKLKEEGVPAMEIISRVMKDMGVDMSLVAGMAGTTSGKFSTFQDAIDGIRAQVGKPILEALKVELDRLSGWLDRNKEAVNAFAQGLGSALTQGIQIAVSALQTIAPYLATMVSGFQTLAAGAAALPGPLQMAAAGAVALGAALLLINLNPVVAGITAVVAVGGFFVGKIQEMIEASQNFVAKGAELQAWATGAPPALAAVTAEMTKMQTAGASNAEIVEMLRSKHETLQGVLASQPSLWQTNRTEYDSTTGAMRTLELEANKMGVTLGMAGDGATVVVGKVAELPDVLRNSAGAAGALGAAAATANEPMAAWSRALGLTAEEAKKLKEPIDAALKSLKELTSAPTKVETGLAANLAEIAAAQAQLGAATQTTGEKKREWIDAARGMISSADLSKEALAKSLTVLKDYDNGAIDAATATKRFDDAVKPTVTSFEAVANAESKTRDAMGKSAEAMLGLGGSLDSLAGALKEMVGGFLIAMGQVPPAAETMSSEVLAKWSGIAAKAGPAGNEAAAKLALGILEKRAAAASAGTELGDAAIAALRAAVASAQASGLNISLGVARGILDGLGEVRSAGVLIATTAKGAISGVLVEQSPSKVTFKQGQHFTEGFILGIESDAAGVYAAVGDMYGGVHLINIKNLNMIRESTSEAFSGIVDSAEHVTPTIKEFTSTWAQSLNSLAEQSAEIRITSAGLKELEITLRAAKLELARDPKNEGLKATADAIGLQVTEQKNLVALLKETAASFKDAQTAADGFSQAMSASVEQGKFGPQILKSLENAILKDDAVSGQALFTVVQKMIDEATKKGVPNISLLGGELLAALDAGLNDPSAINLDAIMSRVGDISNAVTAASTALAGLTRAANESVRGSMLVEELGTLGAAATTAFDTAITTGTDAAGEKLFASLNKITEDLRKNNVPGWQQLGHDLIGAAITALQEKTPEATAAFDATLASVTAQLPERAKLTGASYAAALAESVINANMADRVGPEFTKLFSVIDKAVTVGGQANIDALATTVAGMQQKLKTLPEFIRAQLGTEMEGALRASIVDPSERTRSWLADVGAKFNVIFQTLPKNLEDQTPAFRAAWESMAQSVLDGTMSMEDAIKNVSKQLKTMVDDAKEADEGMKRWTSMQTSAHQQHQAAAMRGQHLPPPPSGTPPVSGKLEDNGPRFDPFGREIPRYDLGGYMKNAGLARLHSGETIFTANDQRRNLDLLGDVIRRGGLPNPSTTSAGGLNITVNVPVQGIVYGNDQFIAEVGDVVSQQIAQAVRQGASGLV